MRAEMGNTSKRNQHSTRFADPAVDILIRKLIRRVSRMFYHMVVGAAGCAFAVPKCNAVFGLADPKENFGGATTFGGAFSGGGTTTGTPSSCSGVLHRSCCCC